MGELLDVIQGKFLPRSVPVPAGENPDKYRGKEKTTLKSNVFVSLLRYSGGQVETQSCVFC
jgi:hypothetical protein